MGPSSAFCADSISLKAEAAPDVVNITVDASQSLRTLDARLFGINAAIWDKVFDTTTTAGLLTEMGNQALRFPGGSYSDDYDWATNETGSTYQWPTSFEMFADVATTTGAQVFITVNYGSGTPAEAAGWVRRSNIKKNYGFKYWEVGNEVYGWWETDNNVRPNDPYTYAIRFKEYYKQMKAVDPTIKIGAVASPGEDSYINYTDHPAFNPRTRQEHNGWTPVMLATMRSLRVTPDFLIYHRYPQAPGEESDPGLLLSSFFSFPSSSSWASDAADLRQQLNDYLGRASAAGVELDCTETNSVLADPGKQTTSLVNGLFLADSICAAMRTEFNAVMWFDLRTSQQTNNNNDPELYGWREYGDYGVVDSAVPPDPADRYPTFYVAKLLQHLARGGDQIVSAASDNPLLTVCAADRSDGSLGLLFINKSSSAAFKANISISGSANGTTGSVYSYGIPQDNAAMTGSGSADVAASQVNGLGTNFSYNFPAYSANVIVLGATPSPAATPTATPMPVTLQLGASPTAMTFGARAVGTTSKPQVVTLISAKRNNPNQPISVLGIATTGDFAVPPSACVSPLAPDQKCEIPVTFTPTGAGTRQGQITVISNGSNPSSTISLEGTGQEK